ncbi:hypothetical protein GA830_05950 [Mesorhizobium sp. NBSH29]|uniref:hypothetical protein n=1 Tax=Mesorhizobium sp. NBSH29 TaxID=2654249 RepID=UPI001896A32C|nr:hypothetical protein [Mesorhizobium sp. NBSH29]QPC86332.1 hypothetical protein GA830_05950 [Mesorhizobium sp. NBSH29]
MSKRQSMDTAPTDGRKVRVFWTDFDGQENLSWAHYRSLPQLQRAGGDWEASHAGWWTFVDSDTQKRIEPQGWVSATDDDEEV